MGAADEKVEDGKLGVSAGPAAPDVSDAAAPDAERASAEDVADRACQASSDAPDAGASADPARDVTLEGLELEAERLTNPKRSLFEQTDPTLAGVHRGSALSLITGAASGLGVAFGVSLMAVARMLAGGGIEEVPEVIAIAAVIIAVNMLGAIVAWRTRTWELTEAGIMLRSGIVNARQLQVPYEHIHSVNMSSGMVERVLGLMTLDLDTGAADSEGEATCIKGLQAGMAHALREELFRRKAAVLEGGAADVGAPAEAVAIESGPADASPPLAEGGAPSGAGSDAASAPVPDARYTLTGSQLIMAALSEVRVVAQAAAFLILIVQALNFLQESQLVNLSEAAGSVAALPMSLLVGAAVLLLALAFVVGFAASFVISLVGFAGYRAERAGGRISVERGLLSHTSHTVALERIQAIDIRQGLIRQLMGYAEVRASVVGSIGSSEESSTSDGVVLHPFIRLSEVDAFLEAMAPEFAGAPAASSLVRLPPAAARRLVFRTCLRVSLLLGALVGAGFFAGHVLPDGEVWGLLLIVLDVLLAVVGATLGVRMALQAVLRYRGSRIGHDRRRLVLVSGGVLRRMQIVPRTRIQHVTVSTTPFQRRLKLATFATLTAASGDIALRDLAASDAEELLAWIRPARAEQ